MSLHARADTASLPGERLRTSAAWNIAATCWSAALNLACLPIFLARLGPEAFGLIVVYAALQSLSSLFDLGMSRVIARELGARRDANAVQRAAIDLARTLEVAYWAIGGMIGLVVVLAAPLLAARWLTLDQLTVARATTCLGLMGLVFALQWPFSYYSGAFQGIERQATLNRIVIVTTSLRYLGAAAVLMLRPSPEAFFVWQALAVGVQTAWLRYTLWQFLGRGPAARFEPALLRHVWRFGLGLSAISVVAVLLSHLDKLILSKLLPLSAIAYYGLANTVAQALSIATNAVNTAAFPRLARLVSGQHHEELRELYRTLTQATAVVVAVPAAVLVAFPTELTFAWTRDGATAQHVAPLLVLLALGSVCLALQSAPYTLALAHAWTRPSLVIGLVTLPLFVVSLVLLVRTHGARGAAWAWLLLNGLTMPFFITWVHRRLVPGTQVQWWLDVGRPCAAAFVVTFAVRAIAPMPRELPALVLIALTAGTAALTAVAASPAALAIVRRGRR